MDIYLIRHGETVENSKGTFYGSLEPHLNEVGIKQCKILKQELENIEFSKMYVSSKTRARETAQLIKDGGFVVDEVLSERSFGEFEGKSYSEIKEAYKEEVDIWNNDWSGFRPPSGESFDDFYKRVEQFIKSLEQNVKEDEKVLIVTHGGVIRVFLTYVFGGDYNMFWKFASRNGDIVKIKFENGYYYVDYIKPVSI